MPPHSSEPPIHREVPYSLTYPSFSFHLQHINMPSRKTRRSRRSRKLKITDLSPRLLRHIAGFLTGNLFSNNAENLYSAVALSQTCTKFYRAVVESNNFRFVLSEKTLDQQLPHVHAQISLFRRKIAHINVDFDIDYIPHMTESPVYKQFKHAETILLGMLGAQTLQTAVIPDKPEYLSAIRHARSLQNLHIRMHREPSQDVRDTIASLNLVHVSLSNEDYFKHHPTGYPCLINIFQHGGGLSMYRSKCRTVKSLGFTCRCGDEEHFSLLSLPEAFENLTNVRISAKMNPSVASMFTRKKIEIVQLGHIDNVDVIGRCIAERINSVRTNVALTAEDVLHLRYCPGLVVLSCHLKYGAETALLRAVQKFSCLRSIQVSWLQEPRVLPERAACYGRMYTVRFGVMFNIVHMTRPSHLELGCVRISVTELVEIFKILGQRALNIRLTHVEIQEQTTFRAMFLLIESLSINCCNLTQLQLDLIPNFYHLGIGEEEGKSRGSKLYEALDRIRRLAPRLKWEDLKQNIDDLVNYAYGIYDVLL